MIRLVTRCDDAGSSLSANRGIHDACREGIARNVSLMACCPFIQDAAERLIPLKHICFGLHVSMNAEWRSPKWGPVAGAEKVPSLVDENGVFLPSPRDLNDRGFAVEELMAETRAQLDRARALGFPITYMDEHMGVGWLDGFGEGLAELAEKEGLIFRPKLERLPKVDGRFSPHDHASRLIAQLRLADEGTYLVVNHPAYDDEEMRQFCLKGQEKGVSARDRDGQRLVYMRQDVLEYCRENDVLPIRYDESVSD